MAMETLTKLLGTLSIGGVPNLLPGTEIQTVHPFDDEDVWFQYPAFRAPMDVNLAREQSMIDSIIGTTRGNQPIIKVVWTGDRDYWKEFFLSWDSAGKPNTAPVKRPLVRLGTLRDEKGNFVRDIFPARWLLLARVEPEQYAATYKESCYMHAPEIGYDIEIKDATGNVIGVKRVPGLKQIQPDTPPPVMWLWFATVARHTDFCCATAAKNKKKCFGEYAPPSYFLKNLGEQKLACERAGFKSHNPFEQIDAATIRLAENENTGYLEDINRLKVKQQIYMDNPMALLGTIPTMNGDFDGARGKQIVKDYFDRKIEEKEKLIK